MTGREGVIHCCKPWCSFDAKKYAALKWAEANYRVSLETQTMALV